MKEPISCPESSPDQSPKAAPIRVVFLDHTARWSGGEISLFDLVTHLDRTQFAPLVVLFEAGALGEKLEAAGVEVVLLPLGESVSEARKDSLGVKSLFRLNALISARRHGRQLRRLLRECDAQIVHCNSLKSDVLGALAVRGVRARLVWHVRDRVADDYLPAPVVRIFRRLARRWPARVVAISDAVAQTLPGAPVRVVHNGISLESFLQRAAKTPFQSESPVFGMVGRLASWKGQHVFLEAAALVKREVPAARFHVVGSALFGEEDYERSLHELAARLEVADAVDFRGFQSDVGLAMSEFDALVHASTTGEPFGRVLVEAMALGRPVIATDGGGAPEIVQPEVTGLLVPMNDARALAQAMLRLVQAPEKARAWGEAGRARARDAFSIERTARAVEDVWKELLKGD